MSVAVIHTLGGLLPAHALASGAIVGPTDAPAFLVNLSWQQVVTALIYIVLPLVVAVVTKTTTSATTRSIVLAALSAVGGILAALLTAITTGNPFDVTAAFGTALLGFGIAVGSHFGFWKSTALPDLLKSIGSSQTTTVGAHEATPTDVAGTSPIKAPEGD